jgi:hypothetical protein
MRLDFYILRKKSHENFHQILLKLANKWGNIWSLMEHFFHNKLKEMEIKYAGFLK